MPDDRRGDARSSDLLEVVPLGCGLKLLPGLLHAGVVHGSCGVKAREDRQSVARTRAWEVIFGPLGDRVVDNGRPRIGRS